MISGGDITTVYEFHCPSSQPPFQHAFQPTHGTDLFTNAIQVLPIAANACITAVCHAKHFKWTTAWQIHKLRHNLMIPLSSTKSHFTTLQFFVEHQMTKFLNKFNSPKKRLHSVNISSTSSWKKPSKYYSKYYERDFSSMKNICRQAFEFSTSKTHELETKL